MKNPHTYAVATDTRLAEIYEAVARLERMRDHHCDEMRRYAGQKHYFNGQHPETGGWDGSLSEAIQAAREADEHTYQAQHLAKYQDTVQSLMTLHTEALELNDRWADDGYWPRFFLVTNTNGHIHSSMSCHTTYPTTSWAWLPHLSGLSEAEAVEDQGEILCSVCFPSAPVEWTQGEPKAKRVAREEREAKKAARDAKKREKALFPEDPEREYATAERFHRISTIHAAKAFLTDGAEWNWNHSFYVPEDRDAVATLLAERLGTTPADEIAAAAKRAAKRR